MFYASHRKASHNNVTEIESVFLKIKASHRNNQVVNQLQLDKQNRVTQQTCQMRVHLDKHLQRLNESEIQLDKQICNNSIGKYATTR